MSLAISTTARVGWSWQGWDVWSIYVWDSATRKAPVKIADNVKDAQGRPIPGPIPYAVIHDGIVVWTTRTGHG